MKQSDKPVMKMVEFVTSNAWKEPGNNNNLISVNISVLRFMGKL